MRGRQIRLNIKYSLIQAFYWIGCCIIVNNSSAYLLSVGYQNTEIGLILCFGYAAGVIIQLILGPIADNAKKINSTHLLLILFALWMLGLWGVFFIKQHSALLTAFYIMSIAMYKGAISLLNAYAAFQSRTGDSVSFELCRGVGCASFAIFSLVIGRMIRRFTASLLPKAGLIDITLLILVTASFLLEKKPEPVADRDAKRRKEHFSVLKYPAYLFVLIGAAGAMFGHAFLNNFSLQVVTPLGGDTADMGAIATFASVLEIPSLFIFPKMHKKVKCVNIICIACLAFSLKHFLSFIAPNIPFLFAVTALQLLGYGLLTPASVAFINETIDEKHVNQGHAIYGLVSTLGLIVACGCGGILIDHITIHGTLLIGTLITVVSAAVMIGGLQFLRIKKNK